MWNTECGIKDVRWIHVCRATNVGLSHLDAEVVVWFSSAYRCMTESQNAAKKYTLKLKFVRNSTQKRSCRQIFNGKVIFFTYYLFIRVFLFCAKCDSPFVKLT